MPSQAASLFLLALLGVVLAQTSARCQYLDEPEPARNGANRRPPGRLIVQDETGRSLSLLPGLLDDTLLRRGSFAFTTNRVDFEKLRVLGNLYPSRVNGKALRERYLLKSALRGPQLTMAPANATTNKRGARAETITLKILSPPTNKE